MAGELSPDRNHYWDGGRWVSALSPDGAWRWDGAQWRPAGAVVSPGRRPLLPWLVAGGTVLTLIAASLGIYFAAGFLVRATQRVLLSGGLAPCSTQLAQPGNPLSEGKTLCGGTLGSEYLLADCTLTDGTPSGAQVWRKTYKPTESDWAKADVTSSSDGCNLSAAPDVDVSFDTSDEQPPSTVVVADFTYENNANSGSLGIQLACLETASCVDIDMFQGGLYTLSEGRPNDGWDTLTKGVALGATFRDGAPNRMVVRLSGEHVSVYLNGRGVTQADATRIQSTGYVDFYLDNRNSSAAETVLLQRFYVFESR